MSPHHEYTHTHTHTSHAWCDQDDLGTALLICAPTKVDSVQDVADRLTNSRYGVRSDSVIDATHVCETCSDELKAVNARRAAEAQMLDGVPGRPQVCLLHKEWADAWEAFVTSSALDIPPPGEISNRVRAPFWS